MDNIIKLAKETIKRYLNQEQLPSAIDIAQELQNKKAGCFVSLHRKKDNELRGCIGTILPCAKNLGFEIIENSISACQDPRFAPVSKDEFANLDIQVDVLSEPEPIESPKALNPKKYGVIVKAEDGRTGLLLPDIEGVDDVNYQIAIACQKAGIKAKEKYFLYRFTVTRHKE